jgi:hypothetical protein
MRPDVYGILYGKEACAQRTQRSSCDRGLASTSTRVLGNCDEGHMSPRCWHHRYQVVAPVLQICAAPSQPALAAVDTEPHVLSLGDQPVAGFSIVSRYAVGRSGKHLSAWDLFVKFPAVALVLQRLCKQQRPSVLRARSSLSLAVLRGRTEDRAHKRSPEMHLGW